MSVPADSVPPLDHRVPPLMVAPEDSDSVAPSVSPEEPTVIAAGGQVQQDAQRQAERLDVTKISSRSRSRSRCVTDSPSITALGLPALDSSDPTVSFCAQPQARGFRAGRRPSGARDLRHDEPTRSASQRLPRSGLVLRCTLPPSYGRPWWSHMRWGETSMAQNVEPVSDARWAALAEEAPAGKTSRCAFGLHVTACSNVHAKKRA